MVTSLIAAGAVIVAASVTAIAGAYVARRKITEMELFNSFEQAKQYLGSARNYTQSVYLPLAVETYMLHNHFLTFKAAESGDDQLTAAAEFKAECAKFVSSVEDLFGRGAAAVLTMRLDEALTKFVSFLQESITADKKKTVNEVVLEANIGFFGVRTSVSRVSLLSRRISIYDGLSIGLPGLMLAFRQNLRVAGAPIASRDFEEEFTIYIGTIKSAIKEVTLGAFVSPPDT